ncbi:hypothetical protein [Nostoc sp. 'Lobaria pulmonaria (5183) cyanobiont']|uniref:hypothetical protein n=1 Tax=Nostoc sp. 'Lobaria pulmonaria (5183) cyanobiont' TaxID=1618022 RepID=UPI003FA57E1E
MIVRSAPESGWCISLANLFLFTPVTVNLLTLPKDLTLIVASSSQPKQPNMKRVIKADFLEGRLSTTLAVYQITKTNIVTDDPNNSNPDFFIQVLRVRITN